MITTGFGNRTAFFEPCQACWEDEGGGGEEKGEGGREDRKWHEGEGEGGQEGQEVDEGEGEGEKVKLEGQQLLEIWRLERWLVHGAGGWPGRNNENANGPMRGCLVNSGYCPGNSIAPR